MEHIEHPKDKGIFLKKDRHVGLAHRIMDRHINEVDWDSLSLDEKVVHAACMSSRSWSQPILSHMALDNLSVSSTRIGNLKETART